MNYHWRYDPELAQRAREADHEELLAAHEAVSEGGKALSDLPDRVVELLIGQRSANQELKWRTAAYWRERIEKLPCPRVRHAVACVVYWDYVFALGDLDPWWTEKVLRMRPPVANEKIHAGLRELGYTDYKATRRLRFEDHESSMQRGEKAS